MKYTIATITHSKKSLDKAVYEVKEKEKEIKVTFCDNFPNIKCNSNIK